MRVLIACYFRYPIPTGLSNYIDQLTKGLVQRGHQVTVFAEDPDGVKYYLTNDNKSLDKEPLRILAESRVRLGYRSYEYVPLWIIDYETSKYAYELAAAQLLDWSKYDLIHAQEIHSARVMSRLKPKNMPLVLTLHGCAAHETIRQLGYRSLPTNLDGEFIRTRERYGILSADICIVPSKWLKNVFVDDFGVPADHINVVHHGMDISHFILSAQQQPAFRFPTDKKIIFCHARLDPFKGHKYLIDALAKLRKRRQDWCCYIAGDGSERSHLERRAARLGLSNDIIFMGIRQDIPSLLNQVDIMVQASTQEAWGFTVSEAAVAGKAIVCTDVGGFSEMIRHKKTGLLVPAKSRRAIKTRIERLLTNKSLRLRLGKNAQAWAQNHLSLDRFTQDTLGVYEQAFRVQKCSVPSELFLNIIETSRRVGRHTKSTSTDKPLSGIQSVGGNDE